ncbi:MAG TPA: UDP-glucose/GDP-mannose dehydrogenase family protein [Candidatus Saccharimonadales bacterium]|nr:UDP-glucose/GDP-mannose dehydrogenase family protein [Candidatus Saccharimonadales bacterium]
MTITFIGHGYVGLVTAAVFADFGNKVWVVGRTPSKIDRLKKGDPIFYEPELKELLQRNLDAERIQFTLDYQEAVGESDVVFIAVGTPPQSTGEADLSTVFEVAQKIGKNLKKGFTVVSCKSTVTIGTNKKIAEIVEKAKPDGAEFAIASVPEFLAQGTAIQNTFHPDRVVLGSDSKEAIALLTELHKPIDAPNIVTDLASAELIKYTANAMLATKISFANLIAEFSEKTGANVESVLDAVGIDRRIGRVFMNPGVGYGGSCFPKDVKALIQIGKSLGIDTVLLEGVEKVNLDMRHNVIDKIVSNSKDKDIAILGLSFKPNTDDIREAPSVYIIKELLEKGFKINVYDPEAMVKIKGLFGDKINFFGDSYSALDGKSTLVVLTEWNEFKELDLEKVKQMGVEIIIDGRNIYDPEKMRSLGINYIGVGR